MNYTHNWDIGLSIVPPEVASAIHENPCWQDDLAVMVRKSISAIKGNTATGNDWATVADAECREWKLRLYEHLNPAQSPFPRRAVV